MCVVAPHAQGKVAIVIEDVACHLGITAATIGAEFAANQLVPSFATNRIEVSFVLQDAVADCVGIVVQCAPATCAVGMIQVVVWMRVRHPVGVPARFQRVIAAVYYGVLHVGPQRNALTVVVGVRLR